MDQTETLFLALVLFVEVTVLVIHNQHCTDTVRKMKSFVEGKKNRYNLKIEAIEEENEQLLEQTDKMRNELEARRGQ
ncbi:hypothetical protein [Salidesulfovibrio onnuriiensis]|uniref:hypothetical protein n=1 Tax=Salidesulfovibrio onnuriiensis TaxID=2583823 RepID=UPI0011CCB5B1|nr:hypothetical protein [Salidesulfovibrio onnuriiensis]